MAQPPLPRCCIKLRTREVEKTFTQVAVDLREILVLDGIDILDNPPGFRIRSHDLCGPLPDLLIEDTGDRYPVLDRIINETAKLIAMVRIRRDLAKTFPKCEFLLPTSMGKNKLVGIHAKGRTMLSEGPSFWGAYYELMIKTVRELL